MAHHVVCVTFDGIAPFELGIVAEVFALPRPELDVDWWYTFTLCAAVPGPLRATGGFDVLVREGLGAVGRADTVIVPSVPDVHGDIPPEVVHVLQAAHGRGARVMSICTGAFALAAAGLLDGREATTHWRHAALLQQRYPAVRVNPGVLYVDDADVLTSAGTAAGIDLCLHVIRGDHGAEIAGRVARRMVVAAHREGGQAQFAEHPVASAPPDDPVATAMSYAADHLDQRLSLHRLAEITHLSVRQFERRFTRAVGASPGRWVTEQRIRASQRLLERPDIPIDAVAQRVGLTPAGFRFHFRAVVGVSPSDYRRQFHS
ncbi:AraC family transcriptional regulator [Longispora fulva]|uniref:AraC family transcriptional activator FtrA n=1 Tax=Longispora fulva TaxID=619741 RepID=A0A8J7GFN0_9ACTN|nr:helix-turn-helix domain-containing protein [Longispora fulva]MBG6135682.1 AraC family transcriptional activator FtrA [Longispora fulva]GIG56079.1 AraC family transcriptional regulator [Longispora fulva]